MDLLQLGELVRLDDSWKKCTGKGIDVAVIDSGIDASHPKLKGKVVESVEAVIKKDKIEFLPSSFTDSTGHGTACAGIIVSIAPDVRLHSIKVLGGTNVNDGRALLAGIEYSIKRHIQIVNLSVGTTKPQYFAPLHDLLDKAYQAGCVVVAAANNLPYPSYPSVFSSSLISVRRSEETDPFNFGFHYGEVIELTAPGVNVNTTWLNGEYRKLTGNSFACPHIVGIIALLLERFPKLTPFQVKTLLYSIARRNQAREF
jgi:subtilisin family serine protease